MERDPRKVTQTVLQHAQQMAQESQARAIIVSADVFSAAEDLKAHLANKPKVKTVIVTRKPAPFEDLLCDSIQIIQVPDVDLTRMGQIKMAILLGFFRGAWRQGDRLVCLSGIARSDDVDAILFAEVGEEFEMFATAEGEQLQQLRNPEVFEKVLEIAVELGQEGREGKPVGAIYVIGETDHVRQFTEPLMLNPFQGHPEEQRNILDPFLRETVKELSTLDGAFLIRDDGVVEAAGVYLRSVIPGSVLPRGLGTRHRSAAAITAATKATAITVSESTGTVTVFRDGKIITEIENPRPIGSMAPQARDAFARPSPLTRKNLERKERRPKPTKNEDSQRKRD